MSGPMLVDSSATLRPPSAAPPVGMVISVNFSTTGFGKRWAHCHQLANYLARFASANEGDPERHSTLLSTFFNELLEAIYRNHANQGRISIDFERRQQGILLSASIPVDSGSMEFYRRAADLLRLPDPMGWYRERLEHDAPDEEANILGILELAVVYGSKLTVAVPPNGATDGMLHLKVDFPLNEVEEL